MPSNRKSSIARWPVVSWIVSAALIVAVHCDGFCADPRAYLTALKWRLLRKRVRARGQFALLLSRSSRAYALWVLREQRHLQAHSAHDQPPPIIALISAGSPEDITASLDSLTAEGLDAIVIDTADPGAFDDAIAVIDWLRDPWLLPMQAGDRLAKGAAAAYRAAMAETRAAVIFADDDLLDHKKRRTKPHFKPDWNSELYRHFDYLTGAAIVRTGPAAALSALSGHVDWASRLVADAAAAGGAHHVRQMLHHRIARPAPALSVAPLAIAANLPPMSVIIPTRNRADLLATCIDGLDKVDYPAVEIIVVDNASDDPATLNYLEALPERNRSGRPFRVIAHPGPFNYSAINNRAVAQATGDLVCLLNNDVEMLTPDWLKIMATQALRDDVGAVGAQLLYPDGRVQHAGVVIGVGNAAGHAHRFVRPDEEGYFRRHSLPQFVSAVTAACMVVQRQRFLAVGALDEANFSVAFNDVDLCLRLNERGWQSLYEPRAVLIHHESVSRGFDTDPVGAARFAGELAALKRRWHTDRIVDPFHHPHLSRASEQYAMTLESWTSS